jgi:unsaturated rhamnogalacturonyl hydrolase
MIERKWKPLLYLLLTLALIAGIGCGDDDDDDDDDDDTGDDDSADDDDDTSELPQYVQLAVDVADTWMRTYDPGLNAWSWDSGVMMMGMIALSEEMNRWNMPDADRFVDYARAWIDHHIAAGYTIASSDTSIPGYTCLVLYERTGDAKYLQAADRVWDYIANRAPRTSDGGLVHMGWLSGPQIWIDSLFMVGPFGLKYAQITGNEDPYAELADQFEIFRLHLWDPDFSLYRHRYDDETGELAPEEDLFWGRGNGWVFVASNMALTQLPKSVIDSLDFDLEADLMQMLQAAASYDEPGNRLHTILNEPASYYETSAGLLFAYGAMLGEKVYGEDQVDQIANWVQAAIDQIVVDEAGDTLMLGTSYGTNPGDLAYYNQVLKGENVAYGIGLYMLSAVAAANYEPVGSLLEMPSGNSDEKYAHPPIPCEGVECGKFWIARGNFDRAKELFAEVIALDEPSPEAHMFDAVIDLVRFVFEAVVWIDQYYIGDIGLGGLIGQFKAGIPPAADAIIDDLEGVQPYTEFSSELWRLLIIEGGGHTAFGQREFDLGEAYLVDGLMEVLKGVVLLITPASAETLFVPRNVDELKGEISTLALRADAKDLDAGLTELIAGIDDLLAGINAIMDEPDDQSDDLIPKNLLELTGTFVIPGVLVETDVMEMLIGFGIPEDFLLGLSMPGDLIDLLETVRTVLVVLQTLTI